ncbi:glutamine-synthetase adenylyltransferase [Jannaschia seohaensis]|uniref:Glutamate-ammonia-ligase adenylyltransferase n=1 Tax=Jannaschia seohaensis TaxID=475081 RepID=A0A2Y9AG03_9RHOB|nr:glutamine-synthetase adenylyltransferase [Jannaschia seohaensis]PWJ20847.1 glutamate-ammonia-ligase adenylyltransferase [Jannaschia seohaensis]SSA41257.1 glutamate-ammonia-ligase adenylyltransferase [Jannaschia seohaensis]
MFRDQIARHPLPYDTSAGAEAVARLSPPSQAEALVSGVAGCSPYLSAAMLKEAVWLDGVWDRAPEETLDETLRGLADLRGDPRVALREVKRRMAVLVGLAELGGVWPVMEATAAWTRVADAVLETALAWALARHGRDLIGPSGGLVAMAMGKMGAGELNYSSDIDLVLLFDESRYAPSDYAEIRARLIKAARMAMAALSDVTAEGYVFRTDLRLRPDPGSTPIVLSMEAAERYFEALGRTWERAAWIKARPAAGDIVAGEAFLERMRPFVWRRHLDFAVVQDAHEMRLRIRDHKRLGGPWDIPGHDVKLGQGGIREIEFFAQTHQIVSGGRDPSLRVRGTLEALDRLVAAGWVEADLAVTLGDSYRYLRRVEHRLQMVQDAQTHRMPTSDDGLDRIARFMGQAETDAFIRDLRGKLEAVEAIVEPRFRPAEPVAAPDPIPGADTVTERWVTYPALRSDRAQRIFARLRAPLLTSLSRAARPEEALAAFDDFLRGLPAGVQVFSLFEANPILVDLIADICTVAPDLARYLARNSGVFDAVIGGDFLAPLPEAYDASAHVGGDFESGLASLRRWHREAHFRIGVHLLRGLATPREAGFAYTRLAEAALAACWTLAEAETERRYGRVPGLRLAGLGMGSLGSGRLTARSDLDLVVLHDGAAPGAVSEGRRSLAASQWAAKFTQTLITALSAPMGEGRLYEVDMRLRPSGRQGPVATALSGFRTYQSEEAWVWEHMALTRARAVAGDAELQAAAEDARCAVLTASRFDAAQIVDEVANMRRRLLEAGRRGGYLALKNGPGRMQEIELVAQAHALIAKADARPVVDQLAVPGWLTEEERAVLTATYGTLSDAQQVLRLLSSDAPPGPLGSGGEALLAERMGLPDVAAVAEACDVAADKARAAIEAALDRGAG